MKKRILAVILCVTMLFGMTACGGGKEPQGQSQDIGKDSGKDSGNDLGNDLGNV